MVRTWVGDFGDVSTCERVYSEDCGDVALGIGFFVGSYFVGYFDGSGVDTVCEYVAFYDVV